MTYNIAIDGPAGAGKSTIAKKLAKELGFVYVDTGAMYRALAYYFMKKGIAAEQEDAIVEACEEADVTLCYEDGQQQVILNGENVGGVIRTEEVGKTASVTSAYPAVRKKLVALQKRLAASENVIMDGRDIGTVVLPDADVKIYLTASVAVRAMRRYRESIEKGEQKTYDEVESLVEKRDYQDMHRENSPLVQAEDAVYLDSSDMTLAQVVKAITDMIDEKRQA